MATRIASSPPIIDTVRIAALIPHLGKPLQFSKVFSNPIAAGVTFRQGDSSLRSYIVFKTPARQANLYFSNVECFPDILSTTTKVALVGSVLALSISLLKLGQ